MSALEPTAEDVVALDDSALRELVRRLCEAEAKTLGLSPAGVIAGGHQDAKDGGIDVRVEGESSRAGGYIPRLPLGFQVKATVMDGKAVIREMTPKGLLRPSIIKLGREGGAYIIACGRQSVADTARGDRIQAMEGAFADCATPAPCLDFYDASRLADWARQHRGVGLWLLEAAGRPSRGWSTLANWSALNEGLEPSFLTDLSSRLGIGAEAGLLDVVAGIDRFRDILRRTGQVVRLLGQSGMGKTRLVQALFDQRVGAEALPAHQVVYGDAGELNMEVSPLSMVRRLIEAGDETILIVDNCPSALHSQLAALCREPGVRLNLLTIDFDIGPDQPENTLVVRLGRSDDDLIRQLLRRRAPQLNFADITRVTEFSEGNTRIALALANTAETSGSLASLEAVDLLERLFLKNRRDSDPVMRQVARVASLVYAFFVEGDPDPGELSLLAGLAGVPEATFIEKLGDLLERGLAQQRGRQRAILPQALAIHLAKEALLRLLPSKLIAVFVAAPPRLRKSFARRLGVLHERSQATEIAMAFLAPGQVLARPRREDKEAIEIVASLAPLVPRRAFEILDEFVARYGASETIVYTNQAARQVTALLCQLTYDAALFDDAARLLARLVVSQDESRMIEPLRPKFIQLFQAIRSNTQATPEQRFALLDELLFHSHEPMRLLGLHALRASLNTRPDNHRPIEAFGAQRRTPGWWPKTDIEVAAWFAAAFERCFRTIVQTEPVTARTILAKAYPQLVNITAIADLTVALMRRVADLGFWGEGWFAACEALYDSRSAERTPAMSACEAMLRPRSLEERFDAFMRQNYWDWHDPNGVDAVSSDKEALRQAQLVGAEAATAGLAGQRLIAIALNDSNVRGFLFGQGLAQASQDINGDWERILVQARAVARGDLNATMIAGFFNVARSLNPALTQDWLVKGMDDPLVAGLLPRLEVDGGEVSAAGISRIVTLLGRGAIEPDASTILSRLRTAADVQPDDLARLVDAVLDNGQPLVALRLLDPRKPRSEEPLWAESLMRVGRRILAEVPFRNEEGRSTDSQLATLADRVLEGPDGEPVARNILARIGEQVAADDNFWLEGAPGLIGIIVRYHPLLVLDAYVQPRWDMVRDKFEHLLKNFEDDDGSQDNHLAAIPDDVVMAWMAAEPLERGRRLAHLVPYFEPDAGPDFQWTPIALRLLDAVGDDSEVTSAFEMRFFTGASTGEWSLRYTRRLPMLLALGNHRIQAVRAWATEFHQRIVDFQADRAASARSAETTFE